MRKILFAFGIALALTTIAPAQDTANIWVSPAGGSCSRSATPVVYNASTACGTIAAAWNLAQGGDTIIAKGGTYSAGFSASGAKSSTVTIQSATGENAWFAGDGDLSGVTNMTVQDERNVHGQGLTMGQEVVNGGSNNVQFHNVDTYCQNTAPWHIVTGQTGSLCSARLLLGDVTNFSMIGGFVGPFTDCFASPCSNPGDGNKITSCTTNATCSNIVFDGVTFDGAFTTDNQTDPNVAHMEMIKIDQGSNITFRHCKFIHCANCNSATIFFGQSGTKDTADNVTFEGNVIGPAEWGGAGLQYGYNSPSGRATTLAFQYNTVDGTLNFSGTYTTGTLPGTNITVEGNTAWKQSFGGCVSGTTYIKNTWYTSSGTLTAQCGTDNPGLSSSSGFWVSPGSPNYDYHLTASSPLISAGGTGCAGMTDIDGNKRPIGTTCAVGAYEYVSSAASPVAPTSVVASVR